MEELLRLKDECRADLLIVDIRAGIVTFHAMRQHTGESLTKCITEEELRQCVMPQYEIVKRMMHEFTANAELECRHIGKDG